MSYNRLSTIGLVLTVWTVLTATEGCCGGEARMNQPEGTVVDMLMGEPVPMEMMLEDLLTVRIIYMGEFHTIARHHEVQAFVLRRLSEHGLKLALAMEMFSTDKQPVLDKWQKSSAGIDRLKSDLGDYWHNLSDYESLLMSARELGIPIIGINAVEGLVKKVARKGLESLTESERNQVPACTEEINPINDRLLRMRLKVHRMFQGKNLDRVVLAQALRDETMARTVTEFLDSQEGRETVTIVIAGSGHVNYGLGIPERASRLNGMPFRVILPTESGRLELTEEEKRQSVPVNITHQDLKFIRSPIADYLYLIPRKKDAPHPGGESQPDPSLTLLRR